jgi:hypothetical protein
MTGRSGAGQAAMFAGGMHATLQTLYGYWNEVRAGRVAPQRLEIEPSHIAGVLSETFMLERAAAYAYRYRLAGTRLCELFGSELRGVDFLDGWSEEDRRVIAGYLTTISDQGAAAVLTFDGFIDTRHRVELQAILLPLLHGGKIVRIIGAMGTTSAPHWLGAEPLLSRHLKNHQLLWPDGRPHALVAKSGRAVPFRTGVAPSSASGTAKTQGPSLRVLEGGRGSGKRDKH